MHPHIRAPHLRAPHPRAPHPRKPHLQAPNSKAPLQLQSPITSPKPRYKSKAPLQVQSPVTSPKPRYKSKAPQWGLFKKATNGPKGRLPRYKSKAPLQVQSPVCGIGTVSGSRTLGTLVMRFGMHSTYTIRRRPCCIVVPLFGISCSMPTNRISITGGAVN